MTSARKMIRTTDEDTVVLEVAVVFALGFGLGYGVRELISRRRRKVVRRVPLFED